MIQLILILIAIGVLLWLVNRAPFIDALMKQVITWVVLVCVVLWLLTVFGLLPLADIPVPRVTRG